MAILVEHDKRKHEILQKSLDVFVEEGYEDATFQKIADRCGITRTTLYIYFKNKYEIFLGSLKQLLNGLEEELNGILADESLKSEETLRKILKTIIDYCEANEKLFQVILSYLTQLKKTGVDTSERVRRRIIKLKHVLSTILIRGIQSGEFKQCNVKDVNQLFYDLIEASIFHSIIMNKKTSTSVRKTLDLVVDTLVNK